MALNFKNLFQEGARITGTEHLDATGAILIVHTGED